jgi:hypothetical protein
MSRSRRDRRETALSECFLKTAGTVSPIPTTATITTTSGGTIQRTNLGETSKITYMVKRAAEPSDSRLALRGFNRDSSDLQEPMLASSARSTPVAVAAAAGGGRGDETEGKRPALFAASDLIAPLSRES